MLSGVNGASFLVEEHLETLTSMNNLALAHNCRYSPCGSLVFALCRGLLGVLAAVKFIARIITTLLHILRYIKYR